MVRGIATPAFVVGAHRNFAGAPCLERADQNRRGKRRPDEQELLKQHALDRPESAKHCDQKRNWQDGGHIGGRLATSPCLFASPDRNSGRPLQFPAETAAQ